MVSERSEAESSIASAQARAHHVRQGASTGELRIMIFALMLGAILGFGGASPADAAAVGIPFLCARAAVDILTTKSFLTGVPTDYVLYRARLERMGLPLAGAWRSYAVQHLSFGLFIGAAAYAVGHWLA